MRIDRTSLPPSILDGEYFLGANDPAEESLDQVLTDRPLTPEETASVLESTLPALAYLHDNGLAHGDYSPASIVASGDRVKLRTSSVRRLPADPLLANRVLAAEMRRVGETIRAMTHNHDGFYTDLALTCMAATEHWWPRPEQVLQSLNTRVLPRPPKEQLESTPQPGNGSERDASRSFEAHYPADVEGPSPSMAAPPVYSESTSTSPETPVREPLRMEHTRPERTRKSSRMPVMRALLAAAAVLVVVAGAWLSRSRTSAPTALDESERTRSRTVFEMREGQQPASVSPSRVKPELPAPQREAVRQTPPPAVRQPQPASGSGAWAVVAAIYRDQQAASRRARQLASRWNEARPRVYPEREGAGKYYVLLGSGLSRDAAERIRSSARTHGMPADSYVTKLSE